MFPVQSLSSARRSAASASFVRRVASGLASAVSLLAYSPTSWASDAATPGSQLTTLGSDDAPDAYAGESMKVAVLVTTDSTSLPPDLNGLFHSEIGLERFTRIDGRIGDGAAAQWCEKAVTDMQVARSATNEAGSAQKTLEAKRERCGQIFSYALAASHTCASATVRGKSVITCSLKSSWEFTKYKVTTFSADGSPSFEVDRAFGKAGTVHFTDESSGSSEITATNPPSAATQSALKTAAFVGALSLRRQMVDVKEFQARAPVKSIRKGDGAVLFCLGKDTVELDTPFRIVHVGPKGELEDGFVKARAVFDGCVALPSHEKRNVVLKPLEAEAILGRSGIKPGYTAWEMPSIGLNVGVGGGVASGDGGGGFGSLQFEYDLARYLNISELYATVEVGAGPAKGDFSLVTHSALGLMKRKYLHGPFFGQIAIAGTYSYYLRASDAATAGDSDSDTSGKPMSAGARLDGGLGFQLAPRWLLNARLGYDYEVSIGGGAPSQKGVLGFLALLYTI